MIATFLVALPHYHATFLVAINFWHDFLSSLLVRKPPKQGTSPAFPRLFL